MSVTHRIKSFLILMICFCTLGTSAQVNDSLLLRSGLLEDRATPPPSKSIIVPAIFIAYGFTAPYIKPLHHLDVETNYELREDHPGFGYHADDYLRYVPVAAVYGLDILGVKSKHGFRDRTAMLLLSTAIMVGTTSLTKHLTHRTRPNGLDAQSFPSGHTAMAFMAAEFMHQEYKDQSPWFSVLGYSVALTTASLRLYNGAHWLSDVVAGAGYGMLSTKISYWVYPFVKDKLFHRGSNHPVMVPFYQEGYSGLMLLKKF